MRLWTKQGSIQGSDTWQMIGTTIQQKGKENRTQEDDGPPCHLRASPPRQHPSSAIPAASSSFFVRPIASGGS